MGFFFQALVRVGALLYLGVLLEGEHWAVRRLRRQ
jgi:hypothetical protein